MKKIIKKITIIKTVIKNPILVSELSILVILLSVLCYLSFRENPKSFAAVSISQLAHASVATNSAKPIQVKTVSNPATTSASIPKFFGNSVRVPILMYHYIGNNPNPADIERNVLETTPDNFDAQMGYLSSAGYTPISLDTLYAALHGGTLPARPVVLTFDDGYVDFYTNAFPILRKYNFHAVSFIPTGLMNQGYYMSWDQIREIDRSGLVSFEAHSVHHSDLANLSPAAQEYEISQSKKDLEAQLGQTVNFFAYPYGTSTSVTWNLVKQAGFFGAVGTWFGEIESEGTQYDWPRVRIIGGLSLANYERKF